MKSLLHRLFQFLFQSFLQLWRRLLSLLRRGRYEREMEEEMRFHLEMQIEQNLSSGMAVEEAHYAARRQFGNETWLKEASREMWSLRSIETLIQDLRYGVRMLVRNPGFTAVAVLSLALGIGANTAIFSLIDAVLLKLLPVEQPGQLYFIQHVGPRREGGGAPPYPCFERFRAQSQSFTGLAAFTQQTLRANIDGQDEQVSGQLVSGNYFSLLGVKPVIGRVLSPADDSVPEKGGPDGLVAVISYTYWTRRFGQSPAVVGKVIQARNKAVTIIGVTPPEFYGLFPGQEVNISLPMMIVDAGMLAGKQNWWFRAVGRLKPGASVAQARAELDAILQPYMDETSIPAEARRDSYARIELALASKGLDTLRRQFSRPLQALMVTVALVLLIACANVANLLLARATARRKEFAVRLALGASRARLIRQMLTESLLLVSLGGLLGLLIARWSSAFLVSFFAAGRNRIFVDLSLNGRVLLFTTAVALLTGVVFGLGPALQATRVDPNPALKDSTAAVTHPRSRLRAGKLLIISQVALSLLLLVGAGLFLRTLQNLNRLDAGFNAAGVLTMKISPPETDYQGPRLLGLWKEILRRAEALPGARSASLSTLSPLDGNERGTSIEIPGFTPRAARDKGIQLNQVSPGYFQTFGIAVLQGRAFTDSDHETAPKVALLNEAAARFYFGDRNPIGASISVMRRENVHQVVGIVKDSRYQNLREPDMRMIYLPTTQAIDRLGRLTLAVNAAGRPTELTNTVRQQLNAAGANILLTNVATLSEQVDQSLVQERLVATLSVCFGLLALLLACIGLYGVMSYDVARRRHEIGIRMALGAQAADVVRLVMRETMLLVVIGVLIGLGAALVTTRMISSLLFGLTPTDPLTVGVASLLMLVVAALAGYLPARRATQVDPMAALRVD